MRLPIYQVDAFSARLFGGNPAAVCPLAAWLPDATMQAIAAENNLAETAFFVPEGDEFSIRWFTPRSEVDLCGHATLATAFVLFRDDPSRRLLRFRSRSGPLQVSREGERLALLFPRYMPTPLAAPEALLRGLGRPPREVLAAKKLLAVYENEEDIRALFAFVSGRDYQRPGSGLRLCLALLRAPAGHP
jgi:predicted PhzF superfamily epimerase YddE/YHI9